MDHVDDVRPAVVHRYLQDGELEDVRLLGHAFRQLVVEAVELEAHRRDSLAVHSPDEGSELLGVVPENKTASHEKLAAAHPVVRIGSLKD
ncbi:hypothetical protein SDC9_80510 [bioreactor metagenome]|uniref:Uncharacterized protein n=1 Tax=bioreactor metagenome TaxID=1076179 RepID=A0A644Z063_9ZZZZ